MRKMLLKQKQSVVKPKSEHAGGVVLNVGNGFQNMLQFERRANADNSAATGNAHQPHGHAHRHTQQHQHKQRNKAKNGHRIKGPGGDVQVVGLDVVGVGATHFVDQEQSDGTPREGDGIQPEFPRRDFTVSLHWSKRFASDSANQ
jgi:hypothetical protein